jgi:hypothetical protein
MTDRPMFPHIPDRCAGYMDLFSERHQNKAPLLLKDGTSVVFPAGWTDEDANKWRKGKELQKPEGYSASTFLH